MASYSLAKFGAGLEIRLRALFYSVGGRCALPIYLLFVIGFVAPLLLIIGFAFTESHSFSLLSSFSLGNFGEIFDPSSGIWKSFAWSLLFAFIVTIALALICYPIAVGMVRILGKKWASLVSLLFVFPLFISENVRLYGWVLFFVKNGILDGTMRLLGGEGPDLLFTPELTVFGLIYSYLPYMLFPTVLGVSLVDKDLLVAARDLGASRLQTLREIELPLAMPGIVIGMLLTFVLSAGAMSEAKILGGQSVIVLTHDIDIAFTYAQNWPLGAALAVSFTVIVALLIYAVFSRLDIDRILGGKR
ncbi:MAG: ABC transporter permease [Candidatus Anaerobiospirillum merdipullorum]|uniref:ABC transporter permease n=1 Tax=Candidatus Anaerobiospirillum merdipullorum TaxID=2838450 RepID=A0A9E2KQV7_9GAMM|nr:ABC transporter permease [Candidatus Anaerobiospirillum merdipullorum]